MPVADLPASDPRFLVTADGAPSFDVPHWRLPVRLTGDGSLADETVVSTLLWVQEGVVVDLGTDDTYTDWSGGGEVTVSAGADVAVGAAVSTCMPEADGKGFRSYRPAGEYEVIPLVRIGYSADSPVVLGDPVPVTVGEYGRP